MKMNTLAAALCATASLSVVTALSADTTVSTLDDIHFWVGEGTNRCAVALDFGGESLACAEMMWSG